MSHPVIIRGKKYRFVKNCSSWEAVYGEKCRYPTRKYYYLKVYNPTTHRTYYKLYAR